MGTGEFLRMVVSEGQSQCCASPLTLAGLKQSWAGGSCRLPGDLICTGLSHPAPTIRTWVSQDGQNCSLNRAIPLHRLAVIPKRNFMPGVKLFLCWCSALCFIPRGENSLGFILQNKWELPQPGVPVWHREKPKTTVHLLLFPNFTCTSFCGHPKGKIKIIEELEMDFHQSFHLCLY